MRRGLLIAFVLASFLIVTPLTSRLAPAQAASVPPGFLIPRPALSVTAARAAPVLYRVRRGDSLSSVAARKLGAARAWPALWWVNRRHIANPSMIRTGQRLVLPGRRYARPAAWLDRAAIRAIPVPRVIVVTYHAPAAAPAYSAPAPAPAYAAPARVTTSGMGSYQACVIARESGGNSQVMNSSGHYGLYQFAYGTWVANGGSPSSFGHASVSEQNRVFATTYARSGTQPWSPSDGC